MTYQEQDLPVPEAVCEAVATQNGPELGSAAVESGPEVSNSRDLVALEGKTEAFDNDDQVYGASGANVAKWFRPVHAMTIGSNGKPASQISASLGALSERIVVVHATYRCLEGQTLVLSAIGGAHIVQAKLAHRAEHPNQKWSVWMAEFCKVHNISDRTCQRWLRVATHLRELLLKIAKEQKSKSVTCDGFQHRARFAHACTLNRAMELLAKKKSRKGKKGVTESTLPAAASIMPGKAVLDRVNKVLGDIAGNHDGQVDKGESAIACNVATQITLTPDCPWPARVYLSLSPATAADWVQRLLQEIASGNVSDAITIVPTDTAASWFGDLISTSAIVAFVRANVPGLTESAQCQSGASNDGEALAIVFHGNVIPRESFAESFGDICELLQPFRFPD